MTTLDFIASEQELYNKNIQTVCKAFGLTSMEMAILLFLANNPEYDTAKEIVEKRHLTKSHVSISLRSLEERKYVRREYRNGNHRTEHICIQPEAKDAICAGQSAQQEFFRILVEDFSSDEKAQLMDFLERIHQNVKNALQEDSDVNSIPNSK